MNGKHLAFLGIILLTGCIPPVSDSTPTSVATVAVITSAPSTFMVTDTPSTSSFTPVGVIPGATNTASPMPNPTPFCSDLLVPATIDSLKSSMLTSNGGLLSSLVHPTRGMEVRYFRDGRNVKYTQLQAEYLFETTYEADWGLAPGSGLPRKGAFHDVIVPKLIEIFNQPYTLHCNELKHGGATYELTWPYEGNYYSVSFAGTDLYGFLDWETWVIGIEFVNAKPYIFALLHFFWEP